MAADKNVRRFKIFLTTDPFQEQVAAEVLRLPSRFRRLAGRRLVRRRSRRRHFRRHRRRRLCHLPHQNLAL